jgi:hypothetical protein
MKKRISGVLGAALALSCSYQAQAQSRALRYDELKSYAGSIVAFEIYKDKCVFEKTIHAKFAELDSHFAESYPNPWRRAKSEQKYEIAAIANTGFGGAFASKTPGVAPECGYATLTMSALSLSIYGMSDPEFAKALQRLGANSGNSSVERLTNDMKKSTDDMAEGMRRYMEGTLPPSNLIGSTAPKHNAKEKQEAPASKLPSVGSNPKEASVAQEPAQKEAAFGLEKILVESAFACLRINLTTDPASNFFLDCMVKTAKEFQMNGTQNFRLAYLTYRAAYKWGTEMRVPMQMPDPEDESKRCAKEKEAALCMMQTSFFGHEALVKIIREYKNRDALESFRSALVETGG